MKAGDLVAVAVKNELLTGKVNYIRMAPPDFNVPEAISVLLDSRANVPGYAGTMFLASEVFPIVTLHVNSESRWSLAEETSPSGKTLFRCSACGRTSPTPDKTCPDGCRERTG